MKSHTNRSWLSLIYPGSIWVKRLRHLVVMFSIGFNIFLNQLQNQFVQTAETLIAYADSTTAPFVAVTADLGERLIPSLEALQNSRLGWVLEKFGLPEAKTLRKGLQEAKIAQEQLHSCGKMLAFFAGLLDLATVCLWLTIGFSVCWLSCDIFIRRRTKEFFLAVVLVVALLIFFNISTYMYLTEAWAQNAYSLVLK